MKRPLETKCRVCEAVFDQPLRKQGGGTKRVYCSNNCRNKRWTTVEGKEKRRQILKRYESKPENIAKKKVRTRKATLRRYYLTHEDFEQKLFAQNGRCLGCRTNIDFDTARIDHHHSTGQVRGLLCNHCNWAVGHVKDSPETLRNLAIYLEYYSGLPDRIVEKSRSS